MPPHVPRKRSRPPSPDDKPSPYRKRLALQPAKDSKPSKTALFNAIDTPQSAKRSIADSRRFLDKISGQDDGDSASASASEADTNDFEDVQGAGRQESEPDEDGDDSVSWENALAPDNVGSSSTHRHEDDIQDVEITVKEDGTYVEPLVSATSKKKGPSKRERLVRSVTHTLHVQTLMWHNTIRNSWLNDAEVQKTLVSALPAGISSEIKRWRRDMGMLSAAELQKEKAIASKRSAAKARKYGHKHDLKGRDWAYSADHAESGAVNMSHGDPLLRLLKCLTAYWKKRFVVVAPGIRKRGYMPLRQLREHVRSWESTDNNEQHGERIRGLPHFRHLAKVCQGSRDVGAQFFVSLLRGLGLEVRMVASLQPAGFGFSKAEEALPVKLLKDTNGSRGVEGTARMKKVSKLPNAKLREALTPTQSKKAATSSKATSTSADGNRSRPINLDDSDSPLSEPPSTSDDDAVSITSTSDMSIVDITPETEKRPARKYDRDLAKPVYWAEVLSTLSNHWIPVDAMVMRTIANNDDLLPTFEPRGAQSDRGRQVICYTVAFNADNTAKDVTVRYLRKHQLPGKTKGTRMPVEKVPIYNRKGKIKKYEEYDWFHELMLRYARLPKQRTLADDIEDDGVLKPFKPSTEKKVFENESLAWYKASADFVLVEHLRREEALLPGSEPVRTFSTGKGDKAKTYQVYKRDDVVVCKTVESWHKDGRGLLPGEQPLKYVPIRAVTLQRKREIEDAQRETGEKPQQGLYSIEQTDWIIPPPIVDGVIPTNAFGNMDVFAPTMVPAGAVHLPLKGSAKLCRRLEISYAEACTGFEFGKQRAVPVITGVVVARENAARVRQAWKDEQAEIKRKEDVKRTAASLHWWRKMLLSMRVIDRMKADYTLASDKQDTYNPFVRKTATAQGSADTVPSTVGPTTALGGGFLLSEDEDTDERLRHDLPVETTDSPREAEEDIIATGADFLLVDETYDAPPSRASHPITPVSLQSLNDTGASDAAGSAVAQHNRPTTRKSVSTSKKVSVRGSRRIKPSEPSTASDKSPMAPISDNDSSPTASCDDKQVSRHRSVTMGTKQNRGARVIKATPTKSPFFSSQEVQDTDSSSSDSAGEIIAVRRTTARTRGSR